MVILILNTRKSQDIYVVLSPMAVLPPACLLHEEKKDRKCCQKSSDQLRNRGKKGKLIKGFLTIWLVVLKIQTFCSVHGRKIHDAAESNTIKAKERIFSRQKIRHSKIPNREGTTNTTYLRYLRKIYRLCLGKRLKFAPRPFQSKLTPSFLILIFHLISW